jgi:hypothetical protein
MIQVYKNTQITLARPVTKTGLVGCLVNQGTELELSHTADMGEAEAEASRYVDYNGLNEDSSEDDDDLPWSDGVVPRRPDACAGPLNGDERDAPSREQADEDDADVDKKIALTCSRKRAARGRARVCARRPPARSCPPL